VEGDDFVTEDIVAGCDVGWYGHGPAVVRRNELVAGPGAWWRSVVDQTTLVDLEELERGLVHICTVAVARGEVVEDRAVMAIWPWRPLQLDGVTSGDFCCQSARFGTLVADDV
jgi:hypothetical protein